MIAPFAWPGPASGIPRSTQAQRACAASLNEHGPFGGRPDAGPGRSCFHSSSGHRDNEGCRGTLALLEQDTARATPRVKGWLCDFRRIGGFPVTLAFLFDASRNKLIAAAQFRTPVLLRPRARRCTSATRPGSSAAASSRATSLTASRATRSPRPASAMTRSTAGRCWPRRRRRVAGRRTARSSRTSSRWCCRTGRTSPFRQRTTRRRRNNASKAQRRPRTVLMFLRALAMTMSAICRSRSS